MRLVKLGLVGIGAWGRNLLRNAAATPGAEVVAICDPNPKACDAAATLCPSSKPYADLAAMLERESLDALIVSSPSGLHFDQAGQAIEAGLHVLVEKPMCMNSVQARALIRQAERRDRVLMVGHTFLYSNLVTEVKRRIKSGELGKVLCVHSQRLNLGRVRHDVDALWNFAPHDVSIVSHLLDEWPQSVNARGAALLHRDKGIADVAFFQMDFAGGLVAGGHVSWLDPQKVRRMVVVGSEKMLVYDDVDSDRHIQIYDKSVEPEFQSCARDFCEFRAKVRAGGLFIPHVSLIEPLGVEIAHFVECIGTGVPPRSGGENGLRVICVLEAMSRSMKSGGAMVEVEYEADSQSPHRVSGREAALGSVLATAV